MAKTKSKRADALTAIKAAGAQGGALPVWLYVENRISLHTAREAFEAGRHSAAYKTLLQLRDGLSDMIKTKRIKEGDIPDDFAWLCDMLSHADDLGEGDLNHGQS
jgi:hypothetical protein